MAEGSQVCPFCRRLNSAGESQCYNCGRRLQGRAASAGIVATQRFMGRPMVVTQLFIGLCVVVFALSVLASGRPPPLFSSNLPISQLLRWGAVGGTLGREEPWRYLAAVFVHMNLVHLGLNMLSLVYLGRTFEQLVGGGRLAVLFVTTGIAGFALSDAWHTFRGDPWITAGASGSLFGLMGAYIGWLYARKNPEWKNVLLQLAVYAAVFAFTMPVNNSAHLGGFLAGFPLGYLLERERRPERHKLVFGVVAVVLVLLCVSSVLLSANSRIWKVQHQLELERES